ncbi:MAG: hypothetical protein NTV70_01490 [Acidobacteria bacterium]|nr:hypothetical protein [Acidobacteriota bacterium]
MAKQTDKAKNTGPAENRAWFERKVAELKAELEKLPVDRQALLKRELEAEPDLSRQRQLMRNYGGD